MYPGVSPIKTNPTQNRTRIIYKLPKKTSYKPYLSWHEQLYTLYDTKVKNNRSTMIISILFSARFVCISYQKVRAKRTKQKNTELYTVKL